MNKAQLKALLAVNLLYANPSQTNQARKKGKTGAKLMRSIMSQYILSGLIFLLVYGMTMVMMDFSKLPGYFTYYVALFGIIGFSQSMSSIFNVFFESRDLQDYLPLPLQQREVFIAKFMIVGLTIIPFILPLVLLFGLTAWRSGMFLPLAIISALLLFSLFFLLLFGICSLLIFKLTQTKLFIRHKKLFTTAMLVISMVVMFVGIMAMNHSQVLSVAEDRTALTPLLPFFYLASTPFSLPGLLSLAGIIILLAILLGGIVKWIIPNLYQQFNDENNQTTTKIRKHKTPQNLAQQLRSYNLQLIKNPTLIMQVASSSLIMPIVLLASVTSSGQADFSQLAPRFFGVFFLAGIVFANLMINQASFVSNLISLDRENFAFIQSLPLSQREYLKRKFYFGFLLQVSLAGILAVIVGLVIKLPLLLFLTFFIGTLWGSYLFSLHFFARDYQLLNLTWSNISQLFTRGGGNFGLMFWLFGSMIIGGILVAAYTAVILFNFNPILVNSGALLWIMIMSGTYLYLNRQNFWQRLTD